MAIRNHRLLTPTIDYDVHTELHRGTRSLVRSWNTRLFTPELYSLIGTQTDTFSAVDAVLSHFDTVSRNVGISTTVRCEATRMCSFFEAQRSFVIDGIIEV